MTVTFAVEQAGCASCAALVREALEPLGAVRSVDIDETADEAMVVLDAAATQEEVDAAPAAAAEGAGHAYRVRAGSWHPA